MKSILVSVLGGLKNTGAEGELARENRLLPGALVVAVVLLVPSFTVGYISGNFSGLARGSQSTVGPKPVALAHSVSAALANKKASVPAQSPNRQAAGHAYLQVAALAKLQSANTIEDLRHSGFIATAIEIPEKPHVFRVLIGPLREDELDETRADLQSRGFPGDAAIKRVFWEVANEHIVMNESTGTAQPSRGDSSSASLK